MPIYKYTFKKFLKMKSTWIITVIAFLAIFLIIGTLIFSQLIDYQTISKTQYIQATSAIYSGMATFFALFGAIFTGFIGSKVFKDEVEDGTFLIVLSKPQSRGRIIFEKWLAYATFITFFVFMMTMGLVLAALIFDKPIAGTDVVSISIKNNLNKTFWIIFGIGLVIVYIFSSIALLLSTKFTTGGTIGVVMAIGVTLPLTSFIGSFANKVSHTLNYIQTKNNVGDIKNQLLLQKLTNKDVKKTEFPLPNGNKIEIKTIDDVAEAIYAINTFNTYNNLNNIAIKTNKTVTYNALAYLDLNYQIQRIGSIAQSALIPKNTISNSQALNSNGAPTTMKQVVKEKFSASKIEGVVNKVVAQGEQTKAIIKTMFKKDPTKINLESLFDANSFFNEEQLGVIAKNYLKPNEYDKFKTESTKYQKANERIRFEMGFLAEKGAVDKIEYKDFINKYALLAVYLILAATLIPLSYLVVRNQDFK